MARFASAARETIAAQATPPGRGGIGVIRISGPAVPAIAAALFGGVPTPRMAELKAFPDPSGEPIDHGIALFFPGPNSFTGEDVLELHGHGGPVVMDRLLRRMLELGARLAKPGEFCERAFLSGKLDLAQAEAVADLIDSASEEAARHAVRTLRGEFSELVRGLVDDVIGLRTHVEATLDFPDEEIGVFDHEVLEARLKGVTEKLGSVFLAARRGQVLLDGLSVTITGAPNVGKSSLLNQLLKRDRAIVDARPGTTRDTLQEQVLIGGVPISLIDTAGLRETDDSIEKEGISRAQAAIDQADVVLLVTEYGQERQGAEIDLLGNQALRERVTVIRNKIDLHGQAPSIKHGQYGTEICLSARYGFGIPLLEEHLKAQAGYQSAGEGGFTARRRHLEALSSAQADLAAAAAELGRTWAPELIAEHLARAQRSLGTITGEFTSEDLLAEIFSSFCIGK
ncbi:MAG: tRNA uridine-5-carboxymethylaminomethyl(34) synthesis GTPase MnmE [Gammaproteobacteria bacterium]|nr:tRNA uridine-5-carboxymethylaminomethyl(34) synthesis GTPase MnmE [Gammaproteobacteria bacterium]